MLAERNSLNISHLSENGSLVVLAGGSEGSPHWETLYKITGIELPCGCGQPAVFLLFEHYHTGAEYKTLGCKKHAPQVWLDYLK